MDGFASRTGLTSNRPPRRYLWTDAFAVCNDLALHRVTGDRRHLERALALIDQVHHVLGRHRADDRREGWISGLPEREGSRRPTAGGLRIGKPLPERTPEEPPDPRREWDRDGQYYHYLTRWMHALDRVSRATGDPAYRGWAVDLALAAHRGFRTTNGAARLWWKMSIDLSRPLVRSSGHHDPLDGLLTTCSLMDEAPATGAGEPAALHAVAEDLRAMCRDRSWATDDALGAGGLLVDAFRCHLLGGDLPFLDPAFREAVLHDAAVSLEAVVASGLLQLPAPARLPFRELGLAIGVRAAERILRDPAAAEEGNAEGVTGRALARLRVHIHTAERIERFWLRPEHRTVPGWRDHEDISDVMLATTLEPSGYLD
ncbi:MAG: hypothetical protein WEA34_12740 [Gemmatimonadota bacterium]